MADELAGAGIHVGPATEDGEGLGGGVEAIAEVGEQDLDAGQAAGAEPVVVEGGLSVGLDPALRVTPVRPGVLHLERTFEQARVDLRGLPAASHTSKPGSLNRAS